MKVVIGISGKAQHGKDTTANYLQSKYGGEVVHFADLLKEQCKFVGWDEKKDEGGRTLLQNFSAPIKEYWNWKATKYPEYADYGNDNFYSAALYDKIMSSDEKIFYIADVRFTPEYYFFKNKENIRKMVFKTIRVERPNFDNGLTDKQKRDKSECDLDHVIMEHTIINDGTLNDLYNKLDLTDLKIEHYL